MAAGTPSPVPAPTPVPVPAPASAPAPAVDLRPLITIAIVLGVVLVVGFAALLLTQPNITGLRSDLANLPAQVVAAIPQPAPAPQPDFTDLKNGIGDLIKLTEANHAVMDKRLEAIAKANQPVPAVDPLDPTRANLAKLMENVGKRGIVTVNAFTSVLTAGMSDAASKKAEDMLTAATAKPQQSAPAQTVVPDVDVEKVVATALQASGVTTTVNNVATQGQRLDRLETIVANLPATVSAAVKAELSAPAGPLAQLVGRVDNTEARSVAISAILANLAGVPATLEKLDRRLDTIESTAKAAANDAAAARSMTDRITIDTKGNVKAK